MINSDTNPSKFRICKQIQTKGELTEFIDKNIRIGFEIALKSGTFKTTENEQILACTEVDLNTLISQKKDEYKGKVPLFLVSPDFRKEKSTFKQMSNLKKVELSQVFGHLQFSVNSFEDEINSPVQNLKKRHFHKNCNLLVKLTEIHGYNNSSDFLSIELIGISQESSSSVVRIENKNTKEGKINFEKKFILDFEAFLESKKKILLIKIVEKFLDKNDQKLVGYCKISLTNLINYLQSSIDFNGEPKLIENGLFEVIAPGNITKGFLNAEMFCWIDKTTNINLYQTASGDSSNKNEVKYSPNQEKEHKQIIVETFQNDSSKNIKIINGNEQPKSEECSKFMKKADFEVIDNIFRTEFNGFGAKKENSDNQKFTNNLKNFSKEYSHLNFGESDQFETKLENYENHHFGNVFEKQVDKNENTGSKDAVINSNESLIEPIDLSSKKLSIKSGVSPSNFDFYFEKQKMSQIMRRNIEEESQDQKDQYFSTFNPAQLSMNNKQKNSKYNSRTPIHNFLSPENFPECVLNFSNLQTVINFFDELIDQSKNEEFNHQIDQLKKRKLIPKHEFMSFITQNNVKMSSQDIVNFLSVIAPSGETNINIFELTNCLQKFKTLKLKIFEHFFSELFWFYANNSREKLFHIIEKAQTQNFEPINSMSYEDFQTLLYENEIICSDQQFSDFKLLGFFSKQGLIYLPNVFNFLVLIDFNAEQNQNPRLNISLLKELIDKNVICRFNFETYVEMEAGILLDDLRSISVSQKIKSSNIKKQLTVFELYSFLRDEFEIKDDVTILDVLLIFHKIYQSKNQLQEVNMNSCIYLETFSEFVEIQHKTQNDIDELNELFNSKEESRNTIELRNEIFMAESRAKSKENFSKDKSLKSMNNALLIEPLVDYTFEPKIDKQNKSAEEQPDNQSETLHINLLNIKFSGVLEIFKDKFFSLCFNIPGFPDAFESKIMLFNEHSTDINVKVKAQQKIKKSNQLKNDSDSNPMEDYIKLNFKIISKNVENEYFASTLIQISGFAIGRTFTAFIIPNFSYFQNHSIDFVGNTLGVIKYMSFKEILNDSEKDFTEEKTNFKDKKIEFEKMIPEKGVLSFFIQKIEFEENCSSVLDIIPNELISEFEPCSLNLLISVQNSEIFNIKKLFFERSFENKKSLFWFLSQLKNERFNNLPTYLKTGFDMNEQKVKLLKNELIKIKIECLLIDKYGDKIFEGDLSLGEFSIKNLLSSSNNDGVDIFIEMRQKQKVFINLNANLLEVDVLESNLHSKKEVKNEVSMQILGVYSIGSYHDSSRFLVKSSFLNHDQIDSKIIEFSFSDKIGNFYFTQFDKEVEIPVCFFSTSESEIKLKIFEVKQNDKLFELNMSTILDFNELYGKNCQNFLSIKQIPVQIGPFGFICKISRGSIEPFSTSIHQKLITKGLEVINSKVFSDISFFTEIYSSKILQRFGHLNRKKVDLENFIQIKKKLEQIVVSREDFCYFIKTEFEMVKSEVNFFISLTKSIDENMIDLSPIFPDFCDFFFNLLKQEQKTITFLEDLLKELVYHDEDHSGGLSKKTLTQVLTTMSIFLDETDLNRFAPIKSINGKLVMCYMPLFYRFLQESKIKTPKINNHKNFDKIIENEPKKVNQQIFKSIEKSNFNAKSLDLGMESLIKETFIGKEVSLSKICIFKINELSTDQKNPNSFIEVNFSFSDKNTQIRSKLYPRNSNPIYEDLYKFTKSDIEQICKNPFEKNHINLFFRNFNSTLRNSILDSQVFTFSFIFADFFKNIASEKVQKLELNGKNDKIVWTITIILKERSFSPKIYKSHVEQNLVKTHEQNENQEIADTIRTLQEISCNNSQHFPKTVQNNDENIFEFIVNNIQSKSPKINAENKDAFSQNQNQKQTISDKLHFAEIFGQKQKFESFGEINSSNSVQKDSNLVNIHQKIGEQNKNEIVNFSNDNYTTNKSNPFVHCLGDEINSQRNTVIEQKNEEPIPIIEKILPSEIVDKKKGNESPISKTENSDASIKLMRKIPKNMFSESELCRINRLICSKKIDPGLFEFDSEDEK